MKILRIAATSALFFVAIVTIGGCGGGGGGSVSLTPPPPSPSPPTSPPPPSATEMQQAMEVKQSIQQVQSLLSGLDASAATDNTKAKIADINAEISELSALDTAEIIAGLADLQNQLSDLQARIHQVLTIISETKICQNGGIIPKTDICMQLCKNGNAILETDVCLQTCPIVGEIPETEPCPPTKTCNNGDIIFADAVCMQPCPVVGNIPETEACPPTKTCNNGYAILADAVCMQTCPVVGNIPETETCPPTKTCPFVGVVLASASCPAIYSTTLPPPNPSDGLDYRTAEFNENYGLAHINADAAYQRGYFGQGVTVGVLDSGMLTSHVDLRDNVVGGYNFVQNTDTITDGSGHGTLVGGVIAAAKNDIGTHGVAPLAKLMPLQIGGKNSKGENALIGNEIEAIRYAANRDVPIINNSYGIIRDLEGTIDGKSVFIEFPGIIPRAGEGQLFNSIVGDKDMVLIWASGNESWNSQSNPPIYANADHTVISPYHRQLSTAELIKKFIYRGKSLESLGVRDSGASYFPMVPVRTPTLTDQWLVAVASDQSLNTSHNNNRLAPYSNGCGRTSFWCVTAPGSNIPTTHAKAPGTFYARGVFGTSFAAPHVSGALAVLKSRLPNMPMSIIRAILLTTATDINNDGIDADFGWGLINLEKAVTLQNLSAIAPTKNCPNGNTIPAADTCPTPTPTPIPPSLTCPAGKICYDTDGNFAPFSLSLSPPNLADGIDYRTTEFKRNYGLGRINADVAYQRGYFGQGVTVAVVDSGILTSHMDLSANIVGGYDFIDDTETITDNNGHGTQVGGIIAASRGNDTIGAHGVAPQAKLMPLRILNNNNRSEDNGDVSVAINYALTRNVPIINNSHGKAGVVIGGVINSTSVFIDFPGLLPSATNVQEFSNIIGDKDTVLVWASANEGWNSQSKPRIYADKNRVALSSLNGQFTTANIIEQFTLANGKNLKDIGARPSESSHYPYFPAVEPTLVAQWLVVVASDKTLDTSKNDNRLAEYSNGCGKARFWCVTAPGTSIYTTHSLSRLGAATTTYKYSSGTSYAAPHVSGALAVLKSRLPNMPMSVIRALLLNTATDINDDGVDEDFGWGFINLAKAVTLQNLSTIAPTNNSGNSGNGAALIDTNIKLPAALSHVKSAMQHISVAVSVVGNAHYNMPLAHIARIGTQNHERFGDAAADMLRTTNDNRFSAAQLFAATDAQTNQFRTIGATVDLQHFGKWQLRHDFCKECKTSAWQEWNEFHTHTDVNTPFFAADEKHYKLNMQGKGIRPFAAIGGADNTPYYQFGLRWKNSLSGINILAEYSEISEPESFMGADFGTLGDARAKTRQKRIMLSGDLFADWQGFAMLEHAQSAADISEGGFLQSVADLRAWGWTAALQTENLFIGDDKLRLSIRQQTALKSGRALLNYTRATCDDGGAGDCFSEAFYGDLQEAPDYLRARGQTLVAESTAIELSESPTTIFTLGYAVYPNAKSSLAFGLEHNNKTNKNALSAQLNIQF